MDDLERLLAAPMPDDNGFTDRVLERLPPQRRPVPRALVISVAATLGTIVAAISASRSLAAMLGELASAKMSLAIVPTFVVVASVILVPVGEEMCQPVPGSLRDRVICA